MQVVSIIVGILLCGGLVALIVVNTIAIVKTILKNHKSKKVVDVKTDSQSTNKD